MGFNSMVSTQNLTIRRASLEELDQAIQDMKKRGYRLLKWDKVMQPNGKFSHYQAALRKTPS